MKIKAFASIRHGEFGDSDMVQLNVVEPRKLAHFFAIELTLLNAMEDLIERLENFTGNSIQLTAYED